MGILGSLFGGGKSTEQSSNKSYDFLKDTIGGTVSSGANFFNRLGDELAGGFEDFKKKAGFNFQLGQGLRGITGGAAAGGLLRSGGTGESFVDYGNKLQSTMYGNYLDRLKDMSSTGLQAAGVLTGAGQQSSGKSKDYGGGILNSLFSDRRLKQDIRRIGFANNGLPIYAFTYKNDPDRTHIGFMADEVEQIHPEAISEFMGAKLVDYGKAVL